MFRKYDLGMSIPENMKQITDLASLLIDNTNLISKEVMEFKSQICTSVEQSKRLLELGLKKETADMCYRTNGMGIYFITALNPLDNPNDIPAWSLHRLMEIVTKGDKLGFLAHDIHRNNVDYYYERIILFIEHLINIDVFNKDYLEEKK